MGLYWAMAYSSWSTLLPLGVVHVHRVQVRAADEEEILCFLPSVFPPAASSLVSLRSGASVQLRWGKDSPGHGDCDGGVGATDRAS